MKAKLALAFATAIVLVGLILYRRPPPVTPATSAEPTNSPPARVAMPRLPAPRMPRTPAPAEAPAEAPLTNSLSRLFHSQEMLKLTREQVELYLAANRRSAGSLLAAFRATGDTNLLHEAMEKFPNDPRVTYAAAVDHHLTPEERRQWLDAFKQSAPDNALANFLSASDHFKAGQTDLAVQDLQAAYGKPGFTDYSLDFIQNAEEAWRAAGYSEAEAKTIASMQLLLPQLAPMKQMSQNLLDLANSYRQAGDEASAQATLQIGLNLGQRLDQVNGPGNPLINQLVGIAVERIMLNTMDPASAYGSTGQTVKDRIDEMTRQREAFKLMGQQIEGLLDNLPAPEVSAYFDRSRQFGEVSAMQWLINKYGPQAPAGQ